MTRATIRGWYLVHKWSSLVCTLFLLMLCVTGLPLIFHDEIDRLTAAHPARIFPAGAPLLSLDTVLRNALAARPGERALYMSFDEDRPVVNVTTARRADAGRSGMTLRSYDRITGRWIGAEERSAVMQFLLQLHTDLFLGLPGMLFLGAMGVLFFVAIVSGTVLYAPFMRKLGFGTLRRSRSTRVKWLDYHNLLGVVALAWMSVVGLTGVINTLATPIIQLWQRSDLAEMTAAYRTAPPVRRLGSVEAAVETAQAAAPGNRPQFVAFPGVQYTSEHHFAVFLQGATPLTKKLLTPALIDAETGALTAIRPMPWYAQALSLSQPLHFGDYGALPLKVLWAILDLFTIVVLGSGLYLWIGKRRTPLDARVREVETGGTVAAA